MYKIPASLRSDFSDCRFARRECRFASESVAISSEYASIVIDHKYPHRRIPSSTEYFAGF